MNFKDADQTEPAISIFSRAQHLWAHQRLLVMTVIIPTLLAVVFNGLIASDHALRKTHVGRALGAETESMNVYRDDTLAADDRAFFLKVRDVVEAAVSETTFRQIALKMQKTRAIPLTGDPVKAVEVLANRYTLNDTERAGVLRHIIVEGDLTAYGLVNAVTHDSQEVADYDRATDFEALGGKLIELPASDWRAVVTAG
jgi:hypothetical protein